MSAFDAERAAHVLVDATYHGDAKAAEKWKITKRTVENYRARLPKDPHFSSLFASKLKHAEGGWRASRRKTLRAGLDKLSELISKATSPEHIPAVTGAVKVLGELEVTAEALNVGDGGDQPGEQPPEDAGGA
jgi:hypothetical protein